MAKLSIFIYPSPIGIDWRTPKKLFISTLVNTFLASIGKFKHPLGHVSMRLKSDEHRIDQYAGMARLNFSESRNLVIFKGAGLGTLLHNFLGRLEKRRDIAPDVEHNSLQGEVYILEYLISEESALRVKTFLDDFKTHHHYKNYGLPNDPLKGQGGGCSAFVMSAIRLAGIDYTDLLTEWADMVHIPNYLIGPHNKKIYHLNDKDYFEPNSEYRPVSIFKMLFGRHRWARAEVSDKTSIYYFSPDKMYQWAKTFINKKLYSQHPDKPSIEKYKNTYKIIFDYRDKTRPNEMNWEIKNESNLQDFNFTRDFHQLS